MKKYKVTLSFDNLDNCLYTDHQAAMSFDIETDDYSHAVLMGEKLKKVMEADDYEIDILL